MKKTGIQRIPAGITYLVPNHPTLIPHWKPEDLSFLNVLLLRPVKKLTFAVFSLD
jgi:hypothetical protein